MQPASSQQALSHYDVIIIGGGLVGASLACALANVTAKPARTKSALSIAVIEPFPLTTGQQPCYDDRTVALSYGSRKIFAAMGLWTHIASEAEAIKHIHISDRGHFGVTRLNSDEEGVEALGYVAENRVLGEILYQQMAVTEQIKLFCPATLTGFTEQKQNVSVTLKDAAGEKTLTTTLLVAADGQQSQVKQLLNIGDAQQDYRQSALVTNISPGKAHANVAYERFTESGPLACLPMRENRCSVVWTLPQKQAEKMRLLDEKSFLQQLQQAFGYRLGQFRKAGQRQVYPLMLQQATQLVQGRVVIVGNAAHTLHPVAGQGFNLALRDIALLAEMLIDAFTAGEDLGATERLNRYVEQRSEDMARVYRFTDGLVKIFSTPFPPLAHCRSLGLLAVDVLPGIKHRLAMQSMGLSGRLSRLNRGISL